MLEFLRRHQKYVFVIITIVIVISFSFFGTYNTLPERSLHEQVAFTAIDGSNITRQELDEMVQFISTDSQDKLLFGGMWGPNFLNDGVMANDFLKTGLATQLIMNYPNEVSKDLQKKLEKEKKFKLYKHPQADFITVEAAWEHFVPEMKGNFEQLKKSKIAIDPNTLNAKVALYLDERKFPSPLLHQVLRYQENQYNWVSKDPDLLRMDLSLFGYHTLEDWFGPNFTRLVAEFIINVSKIAENKGYDVPLTEALYDLRRNSELSFQQNQKNLKMNIANSDQYLKEQLRIMRLDQGRAVRLWQQVLLFRRYFNDVGSVGFTDPLFSKMFLSYAKEKLEGDAYRLKEEFHLKDFKALQKFEIYANAIAKNKNADSLSLPTEFRSVEEMKKSYPELVEKTYQVQIASLSKNSLEGKVSLKEMWQWQIQDNHWELLKKEFPLLGVKKATTQEEKENILDELDELTRSKVDQFTRLQIINSHPEWMKIALEDQPLKTITLSLRSPQGKSVIQGLKNSEELQELLDKAPLAPKALDALLAYTQDGKNFYRILVVEKSPNEKIMTYKEAEKEGVLDQLLDKVLENHYAKHKEKADFQKPFKEVQDKVAEDYFKKTIDALSKESLEKNSSLDRLASLRFLKPMQNHKSNVERKKVEKANHPLALQWEFEKVPFSTDRSQKDDLVTDDVFSLPKGSFTKIVTPANGKLYFLHIDNKKTDEVAIAEKTNEAHEALSEQIKKNLMERVLTELKKKNAISLKYLETSDGETSISG